MMPPLIGGSARAILESAVSDDDRISELLLELDGIANAPMTAQQRLQRAAPLLKLSGVDLKEITAALSRATLPWNRSKAQAYGLSVDTWLQALRISDVFTCQSVADLLDRVHRAEAAAPMLRAGYRPLRDADGRLGWAPP